MKRAIDVGGVRIGGGAPVTVQSMCSTDTRDTAATLAQLGRLHAAGCDIARLAVADQEAAEAFGVIRAASPLPLVADIHFDHRLALLCVQKGADKIRINPGNIGSASKVAEVAAACAARGVPIRIGVNGGSVSKDVLDAYGYSAEALYESAMRNMAMLERCGFADICVSVKASHVKMTVAAYRMLDKACDYPLHLGVTEAGTRHMGTIKSALAFGGLLTDGIGDTLRVSLTDDPVSEVEAARDILRALDMHTSGATVVSCPTCGRTRVDLIPLARAVEDALRPLRAKLTVAVMGCAVNGPGEAREADLGVACGDGEGLIFIKGKPLRKVPEAQIKAALIEEIQKMTGEYI